MPGQDSAVHLHLKEKGHSFEDSEVQILAREDRWFERGVKEAIHVKLEKPSLNRGGGLRFNLSPVYDSVLGSLSRKLNTHSPLVPPSTNDPQGNRLSHSHLDSHRTNDHHNTGLTTSMNTGWANAHQVALTTLILRAHRRH